MVIAYLFETKKLVYLCLVAFLTFYPAHPFGFCLSTILSMNPPIRFGIFELVVDSGELRKSGRSVRLRPQAAKVLVLLASRPGQLVTREELRENIWGSETFVDFEHGLNLCIREVRAALDDDADTPRYVETLPKRGYRFIASVVIPRATTV